MKYRQWQSFVQTFTESELAKKNATKGDGADRGRCTNTVPKRKKVTMLKNCCIESQFHLDGQTIDMNEGVFTIILSPKCSHEQRPLFAI